VHHIGAGGQVDLDPPHARGRTAFVLKGALGPAECAALIAATEARGCEQPRAVHSLRALLWA
jgi:hypothetical protein